MQRKQTRLAPPASATLALPVLLPIILLSIVVLSISPAVAFAQEQASPQQQSAQSGQPIPPDKSVAGELAKETREAAGEEQEENVSLKHAKPVRWLADKIDWSVHGTHLLLSAINFAIIAGVLIWAGRKMLPGIFRARTASIQQALQEARAASQDANRRLADIENRLRQLDVEIGRMQSTAEIEAAAEEGRIQNLAEEEIRKVVKMAEQDIATAAKLARRELANHTASLAIALARKQINVDSNTDQVLVRTFAAKLGSNKSDGGKDGQ